MMIVSLTARGPEQAALGHDVRRGAVPDAPEGGPPVLDGQGLLTPHRSLGPPSQLPTRSKDLGTTHSIPHTDASFGA